MQRVMAIGAHPDDVETGCMGTLLKHQAAGHDVVVVVATQGGYGERPWAQIRSEMERAQAVIGCDYVVLDNPVGHYQVNWKTVSELDGVIQARRIDTVYTNWYGDSHQDHQAVFRTSLAAARKKATQRFYCYELPDYSYRSQGTFEARRYVDISAHLADKLRAMAAYETYIGPHHLEAAKGLAAHRGLACGNLRYAEAFEVIFETVVDFGAEGGA